LRVAGCELRVASCGLRVEGFSQKTQNTLNGIASKGLFFDTKKVRHEAFENCGLESCGLKVAG
jgi:hypothetical protein